MTGPKTAYMNSNCISEFFLHCFNVLRMQLKTNPFMFKKNKYIVAL